jgi:predicted DNA-binding transcriptional regulator AlpA
MEILSEAATLGDGPGQRRTMSVREFCSRNMMSKSSWFKLVRESRAPKLIKLGPATHRVTLAAEAEWQSRMQAEASSKAAALEHARRVEHLSRLGKMAAASPTHIAKVRAAKAAARSARARA